jgi:hypothetical protein
MLAVHVNCAQMEPLWACLRAEVEEDMKTGQDKLHADWPKRNARSVEEIAKRSKAE